MSALRQPIVYFAMVLLAAMAAAASTAFGAAPELTLDQFLAQVREGHAGYRAATEAAEGSMLHSREGELLLAPTVFANGTYQNDQRANIFFTYKQLINQNYNFGVMHQASYGLKSSLTYNLTGYDYDFPLGIPAQFALLPGYTGKANYKEGSLKLELTLPLWKNFFGRETRAQQEQLNAQALITHFSQSYQGKVILSQAEATYWELALRREVRAISEDNLDRARKILEWNQRRASLQLNDRADLYQSEANFEQRKLDLQTARDSERTAALAFNSARGMASAEVLEPLAAIRQEMMDQIKMPERAEMPDDLKAAQQQERAGVASGQLGIDRDSPTLELFGQVGTLGRNGATGAAISQSFTLQQPYTQVGLRLQAPIDIPVTWDARDGWRKEKVAAESAYQRKLFEKDREWADLSLQFSEAKRRLELARTVESVQKKKFDYERDRLNRGRTTTYQVLLMEQDFRVAQLSHVQAQAVVLALVARMKTFAN